MFPGLFQRPNKAEALKQLRSQLAIFGAWVAVIRILILFSSSRESRQQEYTRAEEELLRLCIHYKLTAMFH
ncbi:hypothetical protein L6164_031958 [Bauhinia variegata]|uniref:Uncharacterized protein n=1 Tax=Bauhinia variegata TaxID=167791 RepID=A0ACB9KM04_BAUVA|nr:hypothetical protein L6164_031958 [Bauhinia variegata]